MTETCNAKKKCLFERVSPNCCTGISSSYQSHLNRFGIALSNEPRTGIPLLSMEEGPAPNKLYSILEYWTRDKVRQLNNTKCNTLSLKPFRKSVNIYSRQ